MTLDHPVLSSLLPVVLLIAIGFVAGKARLIRGEGVRDLSNLVFLVLTQALLFRTMSSVHIERLDFKSVALYYLVAGALFIALLLIQGLTSRSAVLALAAIFSNTLMIGVPLVSLAYGEAGLVQLFTLISMHALVLLTFATVVLELLVAHEDARAGRAEPRHLLLTVGQAVKNAVIHPVPLPIIAGLLYAQTGWGLHPVIDRPLKLLGDAFGPVALVLVGVTLAQAAIGAQLRGCVRDLADQDPAAPGADGRGRLAGRPARHAAGGDGGGRLAAGGGERVPVLAALPQGRRSGDGQRGRLDRAGAAQRVAGDGAVAETARLIKAPAARAPRPHPPAGTAAGRAGGSCGPARTARCRASGGSRPSAAGAGGAAGIWRRISRRQ
jgi:malonate transporter